MQTKPCAMFACLALLHAPHPFLLRLTFCLHCIMPRAAPFLAPLTPSYSHHRDETMQRRPRLRSTGSSCTITRCASAPCLMSHFVPSSCSLPPPCCLPHPLRGVMMQRRPCLRSMGSSCTITRCVSAGARRCPSHRWQCTHHRCVRVWCACEAQLENHSCRVSCLRKCPRHGSDHITDSSLCGCCAGVK